MKLRWRSECAEEPDSKESWFGISARIHDFYLVTMIYGGKVEVEIGDGESFSSTPELLARGR
jgi:hypothetical protein